MGHWECTITIIVDTSKLPLSMALPVHALTGHEVGRLPQHQECSNCGGAGGVNHKVWWGQESVPENHRKLKPMCAPLQFHWDSWTILFVCLFPIPNYFWGKNTQGEFFSFLIDITLFSICAQEASNSQFFIRKQMGVFGWSRSNIFPTAYLT